MYKGVSRISTGDFNEAKHKVSVICVTVNILNFDLDIARSRVAVLYDHRKRP